MTPSLREQRSSMKSRAVLSCLVFGLLLQATGTYGSSGMSSGSGVGSGEGSGVLIDIDNCPVSLAVTVTLETGLFLVNASLNLTAVSSDSLDMNNTVIFNTSMDLVDQIAPMSITDLLVDISVDIEGSYLLLTFDGDALVSTMTIAEFNVSIVATDGFTISLPCNIVLEVEFMEAGVCIDVPLRSNAAQAVGTSRAAQQLSAITITLNVASFGPMDQLMFRLTVASFINRECPLDCGGCGLTGNCDVLLQFCIDFTSEDVRILSFTFSETSTRKRQSPLMEVDVVTAVVVPEEIPINSPIALIPADLLIEAIVNNQEEFENVTGFQVVGTPTPTFIPPGLIPTLDLSNIAVIILSIVSVLLVIALIVGIVIILIIVFVKKAKKRQKVLPTNGSDQDLRQSNVGKGHMNLEAVE